MDDRKTATLLAYTLPLLLCVSVFVGAVPSASAQIRVEPPFDGDYVVIDLRAGTRTAVSVRWTHFPGR